MAELVPTPYGGDIYVVEDEGTVDGGGTPAARTSHRAVGMVRRYKRTPAVPEPTLPPIEVSRAQFIGTPTISGSTWSLPVSPGPGFVIIGVEMASAGASASNLASISTSGTKGQLAYVTYPVTGYISGGLGAVGVAGIRLLWVYHPGGPLNGTCGADYYQLWVWGVHNVHPTDPFASAATPWSTTFNPGPITISRSVTLDAYGSGVVLGSGGYSTTGPFSGAYAVQPTLNPGDTYSTSFTYGSETANGGVVVAMRRG